MTMPFHLPGRVGSVIKFSNAGSWTAYTIPVGCVAIQILAIGPGGNGGNGFTRAAAAAGGGGGSGGAGSVTRAEIPTLFLPRVLFIQPGAVGSPTLVAAAPQAVDMLNIIRAGAGGNGGNGTGAAVGTAGGAGAVPTAAQGGPHSQYGAYFELAGAAGTAGGVVAGGAGVGFTLGQRQFVTAGASGAGTTSADFAGGTITGAGLIPNIPGGAAGSNAGSPGLIIERPMFFTGGAGGGSSNTGVGGAGGAGAPGCGGGGGGAGTTGGLGGAGGPGLVFITEFFS